MALSSTIHGPALLPICAPIGRTRTGDRSTERFAAARRPAVDAACAPAAVGRTPEPRTAAPRPRRFRRKATDCQLRHQCLLSSSWQTRPAPDLRVRPIPTPRFYTPAPPPQFWSRTTDNRRPASTSVGSWVCSVPRRPAAPTAARQLESAGKTGPASNDSTRSTLVTESAPSAAPLRVAAWVNGVNATHTGAGFSPVPDGESLLRNARRVPRGATCSANVASNGASEIRWRASRRPGKIRFQATPWCRGQRKAIAQRTAPST